VQEVFEVLGAARRLSSQEVVDVLVADDHPVVRDGLRRALADPAAFHVVGEAKDGPSAIELTQRHRPDVILLDVRLPGIDGPAVMRALKARGLEPCVVFVSAHVSGALVHELLSAGAAGYVAKDASRREIADAVTRAARGEIVLSQTAQRAFAEELRARLQPQPHGLSARELEILRLVADGLSAPAIGTRLHLSTATIKTHLQRIYDKLGVSDRAAAVTTGFRRGLLR